MLSYFITWGWINYKYYSINYWWARSIKRKCQKSIPSPTKFDSKCSKSNVALLPNIIRKTSQPKSISLIKITKLISSTPFKISFKPGIPSKSILIRPPFAIRILINLSKENILKSTTKIQSTPRYPNKPGEAATSTWKQRPALQNFKLISCWEWDKKARRRQCDLGLASAPTLNAINDFIWVILEIKVKHHFLFYIITIVPSWSSQGLHRSASIAWQCIQTVSAPRFFYPRSLRRWPGTPWRCRFDRGTSWTFQPVSCVWWLRRWSE